MFIKNRTFKAKDESVCITMCLSTLCYCSSKFPQTVPPLFSPSFLIQYNLRTAIFYSFTNWHDPLKMCYNSQQPLEWKSRPFCASFFEHIIVWVCLSTFCLEQYIIKIKFQWWGPSSSELGILANLFVSKLIYFGAVFPKPSVA